MVTRDHAARLSRLLSQEIGLTDSDVEVVVDFVRASARSAVGDGQALVPSPVAHGSAFHLRQPIFEPRAGE